MKIRQADRWDTEEIIDMLKTYRSHSPIQLHHNLVDEEHPRRILDHIFAGLGVIFVAEDVDRSLAGMLIAMKNPNIWDPSILVMNELAYWVNPESRGSSAGYKLIKTYQQYAQELKEAGEIQAFTISKMSTSPDLKYDRFGFEKIEEMWGVQ